MKTAKLNHVTVGALGALSARVDLSVDAGGTVYELGAHRIVIECGADIAAHLAHECTVNGFVLLQADVDTINALAAAAWTPQVIAAAAAAAAKAASLAALAAL